jgi:hypothetical protein
MHLLLEIIRLLHWPTDTKFLHLSYSKLVTYKWPDQKSSHQALLPTTLESCCQSWGRAATIFTLFAPQVNVNDATRLYLEHYNAAKKLQKAGSEEQDAKPEIVIEDEEGEEGGKDTKEGESAEGQKGGEAKAAAGAGDEMEVDGKRGGEKVLGEEDEDLEARGKLEEMVKER